MNAKSTDSVACGYDSITIARFWSKVDVKKGFRDCWLWTGAKRDGYGHIKIKGKSHSANRVAFEMFHGRELGDLKALHRCDNKACCNPKHIYGGTAEQNMADMHMRIGRSDSKITPKDVREMRRSFEEGLSLKSVAADFGISARQASSIKSGRSWGYVPD